MNKKISLSLVVLLMLFITSCKTNGRNNNTSTTEEKTVVVPDFNADSAYLYVQKQVDFGFRIPNTKEHVACGEYLAAKLESFGAKVTNQYADLIAYNGTILKARNIIGSYKPEAKKRILLFAHWDTRPWADNDPADSNYHTPIQGANDGASGVGVLLEIARQMQQQAPTLGVDIIFFDAEDYGIPQFETIYKDNTWCLGSQYWARNPHTPGYNARFGILLDMVGGKGATFYKEAYSEEYAKNINKKVWNKAKELGYGNYFLPELQGAITDDHVPVNEIAHIPSIDIIPNDPNCERSSFGCFWHTVDDTMDNIDKNTLKAVGQTVLAVIYNEK